MSFARTKIRPPRARATTLIARPALEARLADALTTRRLVLVSAPAGFGKTSALASMAEALPRGTAFAWVACDAGDGLGVLLDCLVNALEPFDPPWRIDPQALVRRVADTPSTEALQSGIAELVNALDATEVPHGVIVVDDFHRIADANVFTFFDRLLERLTSRWTVAIGSRNAPPLSTARLRVDDELATLGPEDLRFDRTEARALAARSGLPAEDADAVLARSEGWPVGLRLALAAPAQARATALAERHVMDYFDAEVIDRLDPARRDFLLRCSVLPELTAGRCAALSGDAGAAFRLEALQREGLFVTALTGPEPTLRLHDLFRDALEARLERERPQEFIECLLRAAASEPDALRSVAWWQRARHWDEAEAALAEAADELIADGAAAAVRGMLERFPPERRRSSALLQMLLARTQWDWDNAVAATERAAAAFERSADEARRLAMLSYQCVALAGANLGERARALAKRLLGDAALASDARARTLVALAWIELPTGDQSMVAPLWREVLDILERSGSMALWTECAPLGPFVGLPGMRALLELFVAGAAQRLPEHPTPLRALCEVLRAWLAIWAGDMAAARESVDRAAADNRWLARPPILDAPTRSLQAVLAACAGDAAGSREILSALIDEMLRSRNLMRIEVYVGLYHHLAMRCAAATDDAVALREAATALVRTVGGRSWLSAGQRVSASAHLAALDGDLPGACALWQSMLDDARHGDLYGQKVDARLRLADALLRVGRPPAQAAAVLAPWFCDAEARGEWGPVPLVGASVLGRLAAAPWGDTMPPQRRERLAAWAGRPAGEAAAEPSPRGLTVRELEVLALMAGGASNKVIARALELSPHTVKRHVANILDKLALVSRGQAADWYRTHLAKA